jgi:hypothetical protein
MEERRLKYQKLYYENGEEIKRNDIVFYSEYDGKNETFHYADSICLIVDFDNELKQQTYIGTMDEAKTFKVQIDDIERCMNLDYNDKKIDGHKTLVTDIVKIGEYPKDKHMLTTSYANKNYSVLR